MMREIGNIHEQEAAKETSRGIRNRLEEFFEWTKGLAPDSRKTRLYLQLGMMAVMMAESMPEARAENTGWYERQVEKENDRIEKATEMLEKGKTGWMRTQHDSLRRRAELRQNWAREREHDVKFVNLEKEASKDVEAYFARYGIRIEETNVKIVRRKLVPQQVLSQNETIKKEPKNSLVLTNGKIVFDMDTYDVTFDFLGGDGMDVVGHNIDGSIERYRLEAGKLVDAKTFPDEKTFEQSH